jgi:hypothetical protein
MERRGSVQENGHGDGMRLRDALARFGTVAESHPWLFAITGCCTTVIVVTTLFVMLYFQHTEREHRQVWIETSYETRLDKFNENAARILVLLNEIDAREDKTEHWMETTYNELRQLRIAVLELQKQENGVSNPP